MPTQKPAAKKTMRQEMLDGLRADIRDMRDLLRELEDRSPEKLERVKKLVALVPEGAELLKLAKSMKTEIKWGTRAMPDGLAGSTRPVDPHLHEDHEGWLRIAGKQKYQVLLDPVAPTDEIAVTLAHELRHVWQNAKVEKNRIVSMSPKLGMAYGRVLEGDARAFEAYFRARLHEKIYGTPHKDFKPQDWRRVYDAFQKSAVSASYDKGTLEQSEKIVKGVLKQAPPPFRKDLLTKLFNRSAKQTLKGVDKVLVAGLDKNAPRYKTYKDEDRLAASVTSHARTPTRHKMQRLEKTIRTGK